MKNQYEKPSFTSKEETIAILSGNSTWEQKVNAIVGAVNLSDDYSWLLSLCLKYMDHQDKWIAGAAICGLGDIARIFRQLDDAETILKNLELLKIKRKDLAGNIEAATDDIKLFIK